MPIQNANDIILLEGMDMVGKSTFVDKKFPNYFTTYECHHQLTDETVGRDNSWTIGYGIVDFLQQMYQDFCNNNLMNCNVVINRGVFSSYVYKKLYNNKNFDSKILDFYKNNEFFKNDIEHIYVRHHNLETAEAIFESSKSREVADTEISRKYDNFNTFSDYWIYYCTADQLFKEVYDYVGIKPHIFETLPNFEWEQVDEW